MINIFMGASMDEAIAEAVKIHNVFPKEFPYEVPTKPVIIGTQSNGKNSIVVFSDGIRRFNFEINRYNTETAKDRIVKHKKIKKKEFLDMILKKYKRVRLVDQKLGIKHISIKIAEMFKRQNGILHCQSDVEEILNKNKELLKK